MLAYIFNRDEKFELVEKERPKAGKGAAVIRVLASSICGTDFRTYLHGSKKIAPGTTIGHEMCGEIVEAGAGVQGFAPGDIVSVAPALGCGECRMCRRGHTNMCDHLETLGFQCDGSFAEYMEIPARYFEMGNVNHVPQNVPYEQAALAEPIACVVNAQEFLNIGEGERVVVFGSGFIGCMHAELALAAGAEKVMMIEPNETRRQAAKELIPQIFAVEGNTRHSATRKASLQNAEGSACLADFRGKEQVFWTAISSTIKSLVYMGCTHQRQNKTERCSHGCPAAKSMQENISRSGTRFAGLGTHLKIFAQRAL